jgi:ATP-dependent DNA helicase DinG
VIVNHHLYFSDKKEKEEDEFILKAADVVIFDEAHLLPEIASRYFSETLSSRVIHDFLADLNQEISTQTNFLPFLADKLQHFQRHLISFREQLLRLSQYGASWPNPIPRDWKVCIDMVKESFQSLQDQLEILGQSHKSIRLLYDRGLKIAKLFYQLTESSATDDYIHWFECSTISFQIHFTPLIICLFYVSKVLLIIVNKLVCMCREDCLIHALFIILKNY